jgi:glycosyltransferase involved in cell wall biosynthesis
MTILILNQFFWPDTAATGQLLSDVADSLSENGENVEIICGSASYGVTMNAPKPRVSITRLRNAKFSRKVGGRLGSYLSFLGGALWHGLRRSPPDIVVTLTTPPLVSLIGLMIQKFRGSKHIIWEMDVYPDVAVDVGVLKANGSAARMFGWLADVPRHQADVIIALGECMRTRLIAHGISAHKIVVAENWADRDESDSHSRPPLPVPPGRLSVLYSGNLGLAHDVETIAGAIAELGNMPAGSDMHQVRFKFAGSGSRQAWLKEFCQERKLHNAEFLPYCERHELSARLASGHIGLVTQKAECLGSAVPSKTYGIMAAGRPILFIGPKASTAAQIIEKYGCGWHLECGDVQGLVELLQSLNRHRELINEAGRRSHAAYITNYQRSVGVSRISAILGARERVKAPDLSRVAVS